MHGPYADHILDARDVCNNCFRRTRVERVDPVMSRAGLRHELDAHYARDKRETVLDWHDGGDRPTEAKGVWCNCGVEGTFDRIWEPDGVYRARFKDLLTTVVATVEQKGVTVKRRETLRYALSHFDEHEDVDKALATALDAGIVAAAAADDQARAEP
jgi:hypothetical protein